MQLQVCHPQERLPANLAHVVPALVDHPPVLPHLAALGEGGAAVRTEYIPDLVVDPLDVALDVQMAVGLEGALLALVALQLLVDALDVILQPEKRQSSDIKRLSLKWNSSSTPY